MGYGGVVTGAEIVEAGFGVAFFVDELFGARAHAE